MAIHLSLAPNVSGRKVTTSNGTVGRPSIIEGTGLRGALVVSTRRGVLRGRRLGSLRRRWKAREGEVQLRRVRGAVERESPLAGVDVEGVHAVLLQDALQVRGRRRGREALGIHAQRHEHRLRAEATEDRGDGGGVAPLGLRHLHVDHVRCGREPGGLHRLLGSVALAAAPRRLALLEQLLAVVRDADLRGRHGGRLAPGALQRLGEPGVDRRLVVSDDESVAVVLG
mmetsp:Transcript_18009/g.55951  ORF Transcript_18009/g.55951 Transcript_18009/m.55951 type:complete len:227 (+) Transcript_18009:129-809(+)